MKRRILGLAAVAAGAGAAGVFWRQQQDASRPIESASVPTPIADSSTSPAASGSGVASLWDQTVERMDGTAWSLRTLQGLPVIVNFWATWCPPCVREMPMLDRFYQGQRRGPGEAHWRMLGLAVDRKDAVARFLAEKPVAYDIALVGLDAISWSRQLGNGSGGLPFTVAFGRQGQVLHQKVGEISEIELRGWALP